MALATRIPAAATKLGAVSGDIGAPTATKSCIAQHWLSKMAGILSYRRGSNTVKTELSLPSCIGPDARSGTLIGLFAA